MSGVGFILEFAYSPTLGPPSGNSTVHGETKRTPQVSIYLLLDYFWKVLTVATRIIKPPVPRAVFVCLSSHQLDRSLSANDLFQCSVLLTEYKVNAHRKLAASELDNYLV